MVRTKADSGSGSYRKAVAARAPRKNFGAANAASSSLSSPSGKKSESKYAGGNPVCVRPTPTWQKGIGEFFGSPSTRPDKENRIPSDDDDDDDEAGGSGLGKAPRKSRPLPPEPAEDDANSEE
ncbi:PCNA-associated factor [Latimeria chalumnae]|uniref:PCNA-associated factor n=1 Tax=Latimeria chalumnae TaxID=7897 RepID=H3B769_LATCH|nr:PREDICTED: PCNA-associated factor [Latimeria chalumnae]|eukprot:XP_005994160.1 PREDICTED: PCNA-associated factor [Latimeria chalumnae]